MRGEGRRRDGSWRKGCSSMASGSWERCSSPCLCPIPSTMPQDQPQHHQLHHHPQERDTRLSRRSSTVSVNNTGCWQHRPSHKDSSHPSNPSFWHRRGSSSSTPTRRASSTRTCFIDRKRLISCRRRVRDIMPSSCASCTTCHASIPCVCKRRLETHPITT